MKILRSTAQQWFREGEEGWGKKGTAGQYNSISHVLALKLISGSMGVLFLSVLFFLRFYFIFKRKRESA